ncbi:MAG: polyphosphate kinase 1 [Bacteroidaceae bacterium]|nr:polyphosphate kinase 1 [Bacteroidaceae bacterium]
MKREKTPSAPYSYFDRDLSWLSFNYRVLLEANDEALPIYERINFISIFTSNLEEFYRVRVAEHRAIASGLKEVEDVQRDYANALLSQITEEINRQLTERTRIFEQGILPTLRRNHIVFYQHAQEIKPAHCNYLKNYFHQQVYPYLQPVPIKHGLVRSFLRNNRLYMVVRLKRNKKHEYFLFKLPYSKVPRFIELPRLENNDYIAYMEDVVSMFVGHLFPGYEVTDCHCFKISRDADIVVDNIKTDLLLEQLKTKVKSRQTGAICRFLYDRSMPAEVLEYLTKAFGIADNALIASDGHLNLEDLKNLPCPNPQLQHEEERPASMTLSFLEGKKAIFRHISKNDLMLFYPYHTFNHFINFLYEAVHDPQCTDIMITQYRVAENSAVINALVAAAQNGKRVTVFVELKARFDEENNLETAEMMKAAGIHIIYSIPGLKVHAKVALILRQTKQKTRARSYAYISTGNFNEKTARQSADIGLFTCNKTIVEDLAQLFANLQNEIENPQFKQILVAKHNLIAKLKQLINKEIKLAKSGKEGHIILKMNALQDPQMINELYRASEAGVQVDLIIRGICCLIPGQSFSQNIRVTRIVDSFLEHARVWCFANGGKPRLFIGSPDWMKRNLYRRIEVVTPVLDKKLKMQLVDMLHIQLTDNRKACRVDNHLRNIFRNTPEESSIRSQYAFYDYLRKLQVKNKHNKKQ